jgi:heterotetrameric sarcosine oxidase delta subunit
MLEIDCPFCGKRSESEFWCIGEGTAKIPAKTLPATDLTSYLYIRDNPGGEVLERWVHRFGCGEWLHVHRDTRTNAIHSVSFMNDRKAQQ